MTNLRFFHESSALKARKLDYFHFWGIASKRKIRMTQWYITDKNIFPCLCSKDSLKALNVSSYRLHGLQPYQLLLTECPKIKVL
jgi:hypothetical protein